MKGIEKDALVGAIDMHVHCLPDYTPRYADALSLAQDAADAGMWGIVIKSHLIPTIGAAQIVNEVVEGTTLFGSVTLNNPAGGLNPRTVIANAKAGAKVVWLPTIDAAFSYQKGAQGHWIKIYNGGGNFNREIEYMTVIDEKRELKNAVREIVDACKEYDIVLASGHISPEEAYKVAEYAHEIGYTRYVVTHPNIWEEYTHEVLKKFTALGATLALAYGCTLPHNGGVHPQYLVDMVKCAGAENCIMVTDFGQIYSPSPIEGFRVFRALMRRFGCDTGELDLMMKKNPARLLGLD